MVVRKNPKTLGYPGQGVQPGDRTTSRHNAGCTSGRRALTASHPLATHSTDLYDRHVVAQLTVWINMISFAAMAASVGLLYLAHPLTPRPWLLLLIVYTALYGLWVLFSTYASFQVLFLPDAPPIIGVVFVWVRLGMSFLILLVGCLFYLRFALDSWERGLAAVPTGAVILMGASAVGLILFEIEFLGIAASVVFNGTLGCLSVLAARKSHAAKDARTRFGGFLWFTAIVYFIVLISNIIIALVPPSPLVGVLLVIFSTGAFTLAWGTYLGILGLVWLSAHVSGRHDGSRPGLVRDFGISPRESEILTQTVRGKSSKEIAAALFISARTVETHLQNIYQKCGVTSRVELTNLHNRYVSEDT